MKTTLSLILILFSLSQAKTGLHYPTFSPELNKVEASLFIQCNPLFPWEEENFLDDQNPFGQMTVSLKLKSNSNKFYNVIQIGTGGFLVYISSQGWDDVPILYTNFSRYLHTRKFLTGLSSGLVVGNVYNNVAGGILVHITPSFYYKISESYVWGIRTPLNYITYETDSRISLFQPCIEIENSIGNNHFRGSLMASTSFESMTIGISLLWNLTRS